MLFECLIWIDLIDRPILCWKCQCSRTDSTRYPIVVFPRNARVQGQFAIQVMEYLNLSNDNCAQAQTLEIGGCSPVIGTTVNATAKTRSSYVVHQVVGNGRKLHVSTCFDNTTTAHNLLIRNGGCSSGAYQDPKRLPAQAVWVIPMQQPMCLIHNLVSSILSLFTQGTQEHGDSSLSKLQITSTHQMIIAPRQYLCRLVGKNNLEPP